MTAAFRSTKNRCKDFKIKKSGASDVIQITFAGLVTEVTFETFTSHFKAAGIKTADIKSEDMEYFINSIIRKEISKSN